MRAARYYGAGDIRLEDVPEPDPGAGDVKIRSLHNGLCGTDLHQFYVGPMSPAPLPIIVGHECCGEVVEIGRDVTAVNVGDLVAIEPLWSCGTCAPCLAGDANLCWDVLCHGLGGPGGGLSEFTVVREQMAYPLPEGVDALHGALVEPMSVAYRAVMRGDPRPGDAAVVFGAGPIGIGTFLAFRARGVDDVTVVEPAPERRAAVARLGAERVLDPAATDVVEDVREHTRGAGARVVVDAAGVPASFTAALAVAGTRGRVVTVAAYMEPVAYNPTDVMMRELEIVSSFSYNGEFDAVIAQMAAGRYPTDGWVERVPFDEQLGAYERLHRGEAIKLIVDV
jgi:(R,R)-butanediol dehydrogenase / meso-butanediol dehydrogenase / diacetyl reductase